MVGDVAGPKVTGVQSVMKQGALATIGRNFTMMEGALDSGSVQCSVERALNESLE